MNYLNDSMALVGVGDLIVSVKLLVGVGDLINCSIFVHICGFGNSWRLEDTRSTCLPDEGCQLYKSKLGQAGHL